MRKTIIQLLLSLTVLGANVCYGAGVQGKNDILDPAYETAPLPDNYVVAEQTKNKITYANSRVPNVSLTVEFIPSGNRPLYAVLADLTYRYKVAHKNDIIQNCLSDFTLKNFASFAFTCVKNQNSTVMVVATQFSDTNNQPSDFYRVVTMSAKSGDSPASDEIGEMINYANYKLGFFEELNVPQKTQLKHTDDNFDDIDIEGLEKISGEGPNLWSAGSARPPVEVESIDITDKGMKFFLKMPNSNEKVIATMYLSEDDSPNAVVNQMRAAIPKTYHNCKKPKENSEVEISSLLTSCSEGDIKVNIRRLPLNKYEYKAYEIISGSQEVLDALFADQSLSKNLSAYLFKEFFDREILHKSDNVFAYLQGIESGQNTPAGIQYVIDRSTAKSMIASQAIPGADKNEKSDKKTAAQADPNAQYEEEDYKFIIIAGVAGIGALVIFLIIAMKKQKQKKAEEEEAKRVQEELEKQQGGSESPLSEGGDELLAEIEAERMARKRKAYQQQRDAENLAKELEEKRRNMDPDEINRRKAALHDFSKQNAPDAILSALSTPKETVAESNLKANELIKAQKADEFAPPAKPAENTQKAEPQAEKPAAKTAAKPARKTQATKPAPAPAPAPEPEPVTEEQVTETAAEQEVQTRNETLSQEEIEAEKERKRKEEERLAMTNALLMKMKQGQKSDLDARKAEPVEKPKAKPADTAPSRTFSLVGDKKPEPKPAPAAAPEPQPQPQPQPNATIFGSDDMVQPVSPQSEQTQSFDQWFDSQNQQQSEQPAPARSASIFGSDDMVQPAAPQPAPAQSASIFGSDDMVQPAAPQPATTQTASIFGADDMVQPAAPQPAPAQTASIFGADDMVQPAAPQPAPAQTASIFGADDMVQPAAETQQQPISKPEPAPAKKKVRDPLEELARRSKKIEPDPNDEPEIDLEFDMGSDVNLDMFANDMSTPEPTPADESGESILDITGDAENLLDLTGMEDQIIPDAQDSMISPNKRAAPDPAPAVQQPAPAAQPPAKKKRTTKKITKFNLGSLSISLSDKE